MSAHQSRPRRSYQSSEPRSSLDEIRSDLASVRGNVERMLGGTVSIDVFERAAMAAVHREPRLLEMPKETILTAILGAAEDRLMPDGVEGAILVRFNSRTGRKEATWQPMYQGILKNAKRYAGVKEMVCEIVYEGEVFRKMAGTDPRIEHEQDPDCWGADKMRAAYVVFFLQDGSRYIELMSRDQLMAVRESSSSVKAGITGPWDGPFVDQMVKKTVIHRASKFLPKITPDAEIFSNTVRRVEADYDFGKKSEPAPAVPAQAFSLEQDKVDIIRDQLASVHTPGELDAYLRKAAVADFLARLERNRSRHPDAHAGIQQEIAAARARVDADSRHSCEAEEPESLPFVRPARDQEDPAAQGPWEMVAVEASEGRSVVDCWKAEWKKSLMASRDLAGVFLAENEAHLRSVQSLGGEYAAAVATVTRWISQARGHTDAPKDASPT